MVPGIDSGGRPAVALIINGKPLIGLAQDLNMIEPRFIQRVTSVQPPGQSKQGNVVGRPMPGHRFENFACDDGELSRETEFSPSRQPPHYDRRLVREQVPGSDVGTGKQGSWRYT